MQKLKLNLDDLSVESFAPAGLPRGRGTVQGNVDEVEVEGFAEEEYAATRSRYTCPCNFSCLKNCSFNGPCSETV